jgi:proton-dependent oligopeptide transporter, POT family
LSSDISNTLADFEAAAPLPTMALPSTYEHTDKENNNDYGHSIAIATEADSRPIQNVDGRAPTEEELRTLPKVAASMPWPAVAMCLIEFAERASA